MPKYGLWSWPDGVRPGRVVSIVNKAAKKEGGANQNEINGFYQPDNAPGLLFIKVEPDKKEKEFSEIFSGVFLKAVLEQPGFFSYQSNFALPRPGILVDERAVTLVAPSNILVENSDDTPQQIAIIQDRINAAPMIEGRRQLEEKRPFSQGKIQNKAEEFDPDQFAATLVMSALIADYSVHTGNFMQDKMTGDVVRIDFGSALRDILKPGNEKNIFSSPKGTKWYKDYIEDWTEDRERRGFIAAFIVDHEDDFNPENIDRIAEETCNELFSTVYANATSDDLHTIYAHLHGKDHDSLYGYNEAEIKQLLEEDKKKLEQAKRNLTAAGSNLNLNSVIKLQRTDKAHSQKAIQAQAEISRLTESIAKKVKHLQEFSSKPEAEKVALLKENITQDMKIGMRARAANLVKEGKALDKRTPSQKIQDTEARIKKEKKVLEQCNSVSEALSLSMAKHVNQSHIQPKDAPPSTGRFIELTGFKKNGEIVKKYIHYADVENIFDENTKADIVKTFEIMEQNQQQAKACASRLTMLESRKWKYEVEKASLAQKSKGATPRERAGTGSSHKLGPYDPKNDKSLLDPDMFPVKPQATAGTTPSGISVPKPQPMGANSAQLTPQNESATVTLTHHQDHKPS